MTFVAAHRLSLGEEPAAASSILVRAADLVR